MKWLKNIFKKRSLKKEGVQESRRFEVMLDSAEGFLSDKKLKEFNFALPQITSALENMRNQKQELLQHLKDLEGSTLHNPNISEREKQLMEGNRQAYIKQHELFCQYIRIPKELDCESVESFALEIQEHLDKIAKSTARSHIILNEFFSNTMTLINKDMKIFLDLTKSLIDATANSTYGEENLSPVLKSISELKSKKKLLHDLTHELTQYEQKLANSESLKKKILSDIEELKATDSYQKYSFANSEKDSLLSERKAIDDEIIGLFSQIEKAMRKYERIIVQSPEVLFAYLNNPVLALEDDLDLKIIGVFAHMRKLVFDETLGFKDKDKEKILARIDAITPEKLRSLKDSHTELKEKINNKMHLISQSDVLQDLDDRNYKLAHANNQIEILNEKISATKKAIEKIDIAALKDASESLMKEKFSLEVKLKWN